MPVRTLLLLLAASCAELPKDSEGTLDRIRGERQFRVGLIASGDGTVGANRQRAMLRRLAAATNARPVVEQDASEPLLAKLEEGELDLVIGELAPASPWGKRVSLIPPFGEQVDRGGHVHLVLAAKNGENAWIGLLHREARAIAAQP